MTGQYGQLDMTVRDSIDISVAGQYGHNSGTWYVGVDMTVRRSIIVGGDIKWH